MNQREDEDALRQLGLHAARIACAGLTLAQHPCASLAIGGTITLWR